MQEHIMSCQPDDLYSKVHTMYDGSAAGSVSHCVSPFEIFVLSSFPFQNKRYHRKKRDQKSI